MPAERHPLSRPAGLIRIFRHHPEEGPGYFADCAARHGLRCELIAIDRGDPVPPRLDDVAGLCFMGGPMSVNDPLPWIADAVALIRRAYAAGVPVIGHCLGGQLMSRAAGQPVRRNAVREIGWHAVTRCTNAQDWLAGLPDRFDVFQWHGETFDNPPDATHLLASPHCANQAWARGPQLAMQFHVEMTAAMVRTWVRDGAAELGGSATVQSAAAMTADLGARITALHRVADALYDHWFRQVEARPR